MERSEKDRLEDLFWTHQQHTYLESEVPFNTDMRRHLILMHRRLHAMSAITPFRIHDITNIIHLEVELREQISFMLEAVRRLGSGRVLELGCGPGWLVLECSRLGVDIEGVDLSEGSIRVARWFARNSHDGIEHQIDPFLDFEALPTSRHGSMQLEVADIRDMQRAPESYDLILSWQSLHHVEGLHAALKKVSGWLKPTGSIVVCDHIENAHHPAFQAFAELFAKASEDLAPWYELTQRAMERPARAPSRDALAGFAQQCLDAVREGAGREALSWARDNLRLEHLVRILDGWAAICFEDPRTKLHPVFGPLPDHNIRFLQSLTPAERIVDGEPDMPPYEDVSQEEIIDGIRSHYDVTHHEERCGFTGTAAMHQFYQRFLHRYLDAGLAHAFYLARLLKVVDDLLVEEKLIPGIHPLIAARPKR